MSTRKTHRIPAKHAEQDVPRSEIIVGDVRQVMDALPDSSIDCVITSPPYFRLRNYQHAEQIGLEGHVDEWVDELVLVARGLMRILKPTGALWLNLGDTFSRHQTDGARPKSLVLAPERLALAMVNDGWILRSKVIWAKPNPMPTSVRDRLSCTWEIVYFFVKSKDYYFDLDAIRVPHRGRRTKSPARTPRAAWSVPDDWRGPSSGTNSGLDRLKASGLPGHPLGKNPGDVWTIPTAGYRGAHHAVFPERLVRVPLLATCPEKVCAACGVPWRRERVRSSGEGTLAAIGGFSKACECTSSETSPGIVLDPFIGSGTTAIAAHGLRRDWLGVEVNSKFADLAKQRIMDATALYNVAPMAP